ncbi:MAG: PhnD/SsuA/transferrin family substrate-binding protein [Chloroflexi bacterium]|nr:PhnD/SsuA/transferrin family substrate-binding protein [Chloroflexota bacterium]
MSGGRTCYSISGNPSLSLYKQEGSVINRNVRHLVALFSIGLILSIVLVACGGEKEAPPPTRTPLPQPTPTPRSTPLPEVELPIILGSPDKPIDLFFVIASAESSQETALETLQTQLTDQLGEDLAVKVDLLATPREALDTICNGEPALIWVDAFTYIAAERACGATPLLGVRQTQRVGANGVSFDFVYDRRVLGNAATPEMLANRKICRIEGDDSPINWVYPSLALRAVGVDPVSGVQAIVTVADAQELVQAVFEEKCVAGAIANNQLDTLVRRLQNATPAVRINERTDAPDVMVMQEGKEPWPDVPYSVLIAAPDFVLPPTFSDLVVAALQELIDTKEDDALKALVPNAELVARTANNYADFRAWLEAARWGMDN